MVRILLRWPLKVPKISEKAKQNSVSKDEIAKIELGEASTISGKFPRNCMNFRLLDLGEDIHR